MASIGYDAQGFVIDGRRTFLVSGSIHYARIASGLWADRIRAARQAGLNCIETPVVWSVHEPTPETYRFEGEADLRRFVSLVGEQGMHCILRVGPFVGDGYDMGGLPAWLLDRGAARLRQADAVYLQHVARYLDAVMTRVAKLQVTQSKGGPIVAIQNEHEWFCHNERQQEDYLQQISRFLREGGCNVPLLNRNNLHQQVAGTIDTWAGADHLLANCRQLRTLSPDAPRMVMSLPTGSAATWGDDREPAGIDEVMRRMAAVSAAGGMFNLDPFAGGTNLGFLGGRYARGDSAFAATAPDRGAPLDEAGRRTEKYSHVRRLCTFLNQFEPLMATLAPDDHHTVAATGVGVVQQSSPLGRVVFVIRDDRTPCVEVTTPDGQALDVHFGTDAVAWLLLRANLQGVATLDLTNLRPFAFIGRRLLVLFGPAGTEGLVSIDGALHVADVPRGAEPLVFRAGEVHVAVLNERQIDAAYIAPDALHVGTGSLTAAGEASDHGDFPVRYRIAPSGEIKRTKRGAIVRPTAPKLGAWRVADTHSYTTGKAARFATIDGPQSLEACGADLGYGWYRVRMSRDRARQCKLMIPQSADRLHLYREGKPLGVIGAGPGAANKPIAFDAPAGEDALIILADNLGRYCQDIAINRPTGLYGHLLAVKPASLGRARVTLEQRYNPFELAGYVPGCTADDLGAMPRCTFEFKLPGKMPCVLTLAGDRPRSVILANNKPVGIDLGQGVTVHHVIEDPLRKGVNKITLALIDEPPAGFDAGKVAALHRVEQVLSAKADFWYARWQMPADTAYTDAGPQARPAGPAFFRAAFTLKSIDAPLLLDLAGASKGQIYLNGHNLGRYFIATASGKKVAGQSRYYLPEPYLTTEGENDLILFDEHGKSPKGSKLVYVI